MRRILTLAMLLLFSIAHAQEEKIGLDITMTYEQLLDGSGLLRAEIYDEEEYEAVTDLEFKLYAVAGEEMNLLGAGFSNEESQLLIDGIMSEDLLVDDEGNLNLKLTGENERYAGESLLTTIYSELMIDFVEEDSQRYLSIRLQDYQANGLPDGEVYFYVPRLFGEMMVGEAWTDEEGNDRIKFPADIRGDENGEIIVIARIVESGDYGTLATSKSINWGVPLNTEADTPRALWSTRPPLWMTVTFLVLMAGVLVHYGWVIYNLVRMRRL